MAERHYTRMKNACNGVAPGVDSGDGPPPPLPKRSIHFDRVASAPAASPAVGHQRAHVQTAAMPHRSLSLSFSPQDTSGAWSGYDFEPTEEIFASVRHFQWFHGSISRELTEERLKGQPNGTFICRHSESRSGFSLSSMYGLGRWCVCVCRGVFACLCMSVWSHLLPLLARSVWTAW